MFFFSLKDKYFPYMMDKIFKKLKFDSLLQKTKESNEKSVPCN